LMVPILFPAISFKFEPSIKMPLSELPDMRLQGIISEPSKMARINFIIKTA